MTSRDSADPQKLLQAVEDAFRPREVEIVVNLSSENTHPAEFADEQLETTVHEVCASDLEDKACKAKEAQPPTPVKALDPAKPRFAILQWMKANAVAGWRVAVKVAPQAETIAKAAKAIEDTLRG